MIPITIEYKPFGFLWKRTLEVRLPARWSEMNAKQIAAIPALQRENLDDSSILHIFLGIRRSVANKLDSFQKFCIIRNLKYISEPEPVGNFMIKEIAGFKAPGNRLFGVTFGAFIFGDTYFQNYASGKKDDLNRFIACYYTGKEGFDNKLIEKNAELIGKTDLNIREAIAINYGLIREWLAKGYPLIFQKSKSTRKQDKSGGWIAVFDAVVGNDIANQEKYAAEPLSSMLRYINRRIKENLKNG